MNSSQKTEFWSEIEDLEACIPDGKREYLRERLRNELYDFVLRKYLEEHEKRGLTKASLARRLECDPGRLNKLLGAPGNWTLGTVSDLLVGICGEVLVPQSARVPGATPRNMSAHDRLLSESGLHFQPKSDNSPSTSSAPTITACVQ